MAGFPPRPLFDLGGKVAPVTGGATGIGRMAAEGLVRCVVGCTACANTCPAHAIVFPLIETVLALEGRAEVRHAVEDDLLVRHDVLANAFKVPHPDRIVTLTVAQKGLTTPDVLRLGLAPVEAGVCFCEFVPGQYIGLWQPGSGHLSRSYSIANAPHGDGWIEVHLRRVAGGRFTDWAFDEMQVGCGRAQHGAAGLDGAGDPV